MLKKIAFCIVLIAFPFNDLLFGMEKILDSIPEIMTEECSGRLFGVRSFWYRFGDDIGYTDKERICGTLDQKSMKKVIDNVYLKGEQYVGSEEIVKLSSILFTLRFPNEVFNVRGNFWENYDKFEDVLTCSLDDFLSEIERYGRSKFDTLSSIIRNQNADQ